MKMMKRLLVALMLLLPLAAVAQNGVGTWKVHPVFGTGIKNIVDAGSNVYYLVDNNLYCYDKETEENQNYNKGNYLSDVTVSNIYYNAAKKYLVVVYDNANLDIIENSGRVINMPEIKNAEIGSTKTVNDVTFASGAAYVATDFGYVVINDTKFEVKESRILNQKIVSAAQVGNWVLLSQDNKIYYCPVGKHAESLSDFGMAEANDNGRFVPIGDHSYFLLTGWLATCTISETAEGGLAFANNVVSQTTASNVQRTKDGFVANFATGGNNFYYTFDSTGGNATRHDTDDAELLSSQETAGTWWGLSLNGVRRIEGGKSSAYIKPDALTFSHPFHSLYDNARKELWVTSTGTNYQISEQSYPTGINALRDGKWTDLTPTPTIEGGGTYKPLFDPNDTTTYYLNSWWNGIYKVKGGKVTGNYNWTNSPMTHPSNYYCHSTVAIDANGNLWAVQTGNTENPVMVLPKAKLAQNSVTKADWATPTIQDVVGSKRASFIVTHDNVKVYADGNYTGFVSVWNDGGNLSSNIRSVASTSFLDQDDKAYTWTFVHALVEDQNGRVWMGSDNGVISFDPRSAFDTNFRINRIKVPRNDGTNLADYLLDGQSVNCIAVDGANRKWIGTDAAGLFLVSADGSEIIQQFNTGNSDLLSDRIYSVCCNPNSNSVYVVTAAGVMEYFSNSTPAEADYSGIYAYPNPVRPDFNGLITIRGLMENSLVKIADAAGNVVKQLKSNGGMATWDGCNENGDKVKSGVYAVMASQHENDSSSGAVTKIVIIR